MVLGFYCKQGEGVYMVRWFTWKGGLYVEEVYMERW